MKNSEIGNKTANINIKATDKRRRIKNSNNHKRVYLSLICRKATGNHLGYITLDMT